MYRQSSHHRLVSTPMLDLQVHLPEKSYHAYLFDCDGTLVDSMPLHYRAWCQVLDEYDAARHFPESLFYRLGGVTTREIVSRLNQAHGLSMAPDDVAHRKEAAYLHLLEEVERIEAVTSIAEASRLLIPMAVVSGGTRHVVQKTLAFAGIDNWFDHLVTPADVERGKPAPDMFLLAAELLGVAPEKCLVFEDGLNGIEAARQAGMDFVFIPSQPESVASDILEEARQLG